jgi:hypothetical protein
MPISRIGDTTQSGFSQSQLDRALLLHEKICADLDREGFTIEEILEEYGDDEGKMTIHSKSPVHIQFLLRILVQAGYLEKTAKYSYKVLCEYEE